MSRPFLIIAVWFLVSLQMSLADTPIPTDWSQVTIIDVRSRGEWLEGHLDGAIWIPWTQIEIGVQRHQLPPNQRLAFYCERGVRADRAIRRLQHLGYKHTLNLISLENALRVTGRPLTK